VRIAVSIVSTVLAVLGTVFGAVAVFCLIFGYSIILFSTNSMAPTIPQGSLTIVKSIPASEIVVGDVVTVDRGGGLRPVSHRVIEISDGATPDERVLRMQGDNNRSPDAQSYTVTEVRRNVAVFPGLAEPFFLVFGNTTLVVVLFVIVGALITWSFWPRDPDRRRRRWWRADALPEEDTSDDELTFEDLLAPLEEDGERVPARLDRW
jgi:signal peptidase I